jgi:hypothetical protein
VPVWPQTERRLRHWSKTNAIAPDQLNFTNRNGGPLSRDGVAFRLALAVRKATTHCPSLNKRRITGHTLRHSCAMGLLHASVALEVIALWLGHVKPLTTHGYIEADLKMKAKCLKRLTEPMLPRRRSTGLGGVASSLLLHVVPTAMHNQRTIVPPYHQSLNRNVDQGTRNPSPSQGIEDRPAWWRL